MLTVIPTVCSKETLFSFFKDGLHEMFIYRCEERAKLQPVHYLGLPSCAREVTIENNSNSFFSRSHKESVTIRTLLCSTKLTQNGKAKL